MTRFLGFALLFLIALSAPAQDEPPVVGQSLPSDPALLLRTREQLSLELQRVQQMLGFVNPNDTQLVETLTAQQAELARQIGDIMRQIQTPGPPNANPSPTNLDARSSVPSGVQSVQPVSPSAPSGEPGLTSSQSRSGPGLPMLGNRVGGMIPGMPQGVPIQGPQIAMPGMMGGMGHYSPAIPNSPMDKRSVPNWDDQAQAWEATYWGPRLPKELTEVQQSVESLRKEIAELRETIKGLETQIQLLSRTILLSERMRDNGE